MNNAQRSFYSVKRFSQARLPSVYSRKPFLYKRPNGWNPNINIDANSEVVFAVYSRMDSSGSEADFVANYKLISNITSDNNIINVYLSQHFISTIEATSDITTVYEIVSALANLACYVLGMDINRTYQFSNYQFTGYGRFNRKYLGALTDGIYDLETTSTTDNGTAIAASMELKTDFGMNKYKRISFISAEMAGTQYKITVTDDSSNSVNFTLTPDQFRYLIGTTRDSAFTLKFENISGEKITFRKIDGKIALFKG